jgi:hypothetical protein
LHPAEPETVSPSEKVAVIVVPGRTLIVPRPARPETSIHVPVMGGIDGMVVGIWVVGDGVGVVCGWVVQPATSRERITPQIRIIEPRTFIRFNSLFIAIISFSRQASLHCSVHINRGRRSISQPITPLKLKKFGPGGKYEWD